MFNWYKKARVCYVFMSDLDSKGLDGALSTHELSCCPWFTRGWTLQELLAPQVMRFYDQNLRYFGNKAELADDIEAITGIGSTYLLADSLAYASVAQRLRWTSKRQITREEDLAYCLLVIMGVNMPLIYSEGRNAFHRLQQTIISQTDDDSIFAWMSTIPEEARGMLANSPAEYARTGHIRPIHYEHKRPPADFMSRGLEVYHARPHPLLSSWKKICETAFGRQLRRSSETIDLRLDGEFVDSDLVVHWVGIRLCRDVGSGTRIVEMAHNSFTHGNAVTCMTYILLSEVSNEYT